LRETIISKEVLVDKFEQVLVVLIVRLSYPV